MARILGSHPGFPGSIPGQGMKILLHTTAHCCFPEIHLSRSPLSFLGVSLFLLSPSLCSFSLSLLLALSLSLHSICLSPSFSLLLSPPPDLVISQFSRSVVSDSVRPHRLQPTRLPHPWDSLGKNTEVGCHCLLQCMKVKGESEVAQSYSTLSDPMDCSLPGSSVHRIFRKSTGVGCHCYPGSIPGQGIKISLQATAQSCLTEIKTRRKEKKEYQ